MVKAMSGLRFQWCLPWMAASLVLAGCGGSTSAASDSTPAAAAEATGRVGPTPAPTGDSPAAGKPATGTAMGDRSGELLNPDPVTMVLLYHALAGLAPPLDRWIESDPRVTQAPAAGRAAQRELVRAELTAALAAVRDTGFIRLALNDHLSEYDPSYGEFTLRALAPSSTVPYRGLQQEVSLRFANGRDAQVWAVPAAQAQAINDSLSYGRSVQLDVLLKIAGVQPGSGGGSIVTEVLEYEIRSQRDQRLLGRVKPASK